MAGDAALGAVFGEVLHFVIQVAKTTALFKSRLERLEETLRDAEPQFHEMERLNNDLARPRPETDKFLDILDKVRQLVLRCSSVKWWNLCDRYVYSNRLSNMDKDLLRFFQINVPMQVALDIRRMMADGSGAPSTFLGTCNVPGLPNAVFGLDSQLVDLKLMLLEEDASVVVVSGPPGCGKTTLAQMLCHDDQIKDIFGDIFYVTVSKHSLMVITERILQHHHPKQHFGFQTDEEAKNQLEALMRSRSKRILLVFDDVWLGSESLVQNLKFQIPGFRILVTSRFEFPRFVTFKLRLLDDKDARKLFCYSAFPEDGIPSVKDDLVDKIVEGCKGYPLALKVTGASLCGQPEFKWEDTVKKWSKGHTILDSSSELLGILQSSIDALEKPVIKECFLDLGSFPEDQKIAATALMDMWEGFQNPDEDGVATHGYLHELSTRNLVDLFPPRKKSRKIEDYRDDYYVTQHDLLRDLAIHLSNKHQPIELRERLMLDITGNNLPPWWAEPIQNRLHARLLSISTDEEFSSTWPSLQVPKVEVLILNFRTRSYPFPQFMEGMTQLKVLIVTNYGFGLADINDFSLVGYLSNLQRIRLQRVSIGTAVLKLKNLRKLSLIMCEISKAFDSFIMEENPLMLPNLVEIEIDGCEDLKIFPAGLCTLPRLKKLGITYCHELVSFPEELGKLKTLEALMLRSCTKLKGLPESFGCLHNLSFLDISDCLSLEKLPEQTGELRNLKTLRMIGYGGQRELPRSVNNLSQLKEVICDEETSLLWESEEIRLPELIVNVVERDIYGNFMKFFGTSNGFLTRMNR